MNHGYINICLLVAFFILFISQQQNFRMFGHKVLFTNMNFKISKSTAKCNVLFRCQDLITKQQNLVLMKGIQNLGPCAVVEWFRQVDTTYLCTEIPRQWIS